MPLQEFQKGIEFLMKKTFFQFDKEYCHQIFGTPIGSPISPMLADLVLQDLEEVVLKKLSFKIHSHYRYVDDTFLINKNNKIKGTIENFNSYHPRLKFTFELEIDNTLPFLNLLIIKNQDGTLVTNWFRKNTFSGRYLNYLSNHHFKQKIAIMKNLVDTAILLSHEKFHEENLEIFKNLNLHSHLTHYNLISKLEPAKCDVCQAALSIKHVLIECPGYEHQRRTHNLPNELNKLLTEPPVFQEVLLFLQDVKLKDKI